MHKGLCIDPAAGATTRAADGNRTRVIALEGQGSTVELPPRVRTGLLARFATITVCTNDVARGDLVEHRPPVSIAEALGDIEALLLEMVELEDERVLLAAVDARALTEELDQICGALGDQRLFSAHRIRDVALAVRRIMLLFVRGPA